MSRRWLTALVFATAVAALAPAQRGEVPPAAAALSGADGNHFVQHMGIWSPP